MGLLKRDWFFIGLTIFLILCGGILLLFRDQYELFEIRDAGQRQVFHMVPDEPGKDSITIRISGISSSSYQIRLTAEQGDSVAQTLQESIKVSAGQIHAIFKRKAGYNPKGYCIEYIPRSIGKIHGHITLETSFF